MVTRSVVVGMSRTWYSRGGDLGNLPSDVTSFVGRREATAQVKRLLAGARLVTLTGVAGVGKTRLALHVARASRRGFPGGVWQVELANLREPSLLTHLVAETLGLHDIPKNDPLDVLSEFLAPRTTLLVMDNCEHVLDACAALTGELLTAAPELRVLATSREPLGVAGEHVWVVPPLAVPDSRDGGRAEPAEAVVLFEHRTAAAVPHFTVDATNRAAVAGVCRMLEGLPLSIELAAVWMRALSVEELLARLGDRYALLSVDVRGPRRHRTLRDAVEWSFALCSAQEQALWARLSVFVGGFDLEAAEEVCADREMDVEEVVSAVTGLVEKSVLTPEQVGDAIRYRMLETIREYGRERLTGRDEVAALRSRHRDHYLRLAEQAAAEWFGPTQRSWAARLRRESANVRAALNYCLTEPGQADAGVRMAGALWMYWIPCGFLLDGRAWLDRALAASSTPGRARARALWANGYVATRQGDIPTALALLDECRRLGQQLGEPTLEAHADSMAGLTLTFADDLPRATEALHRSLAYYRCTGAGPDTQQALALFFLAYVNCLKGDTDGAIALCRECEALSVAREEHWVRAWALWGLGLARWLRGDLVDAQVQFRSALRINDEFGDRSGVLLTAAALAWTAATSGDAERAARLLGATRALWAPLGTYLRGHRAFLRWSDDCECRARGLLGDDAFAACEAKGARFGLDALVADALDLPRQQAPGPDQTQPTFDPLTEREREVAELIAEGLSNKQIAVRLVISQRTAESHVEHILTKLGFNSRTQIAGWTLRNAGRTVPGDAT